MKKTKILFGVCVLGLVLTGCNDVITPTNQNTSQHEHLFSSDWVYDAEYHWHESTCGHDVTSGKAKHVFKSAVTEPTATARGYTTYTCEICNYKYEDNYVNPVSYVSVPTGLSYASASKTLEWNIVSGATSYVVSVDGRERTTALNYYDVSSLGLVDGEHTAKVKAVNATLGKESEYCALISFNYASGGSQQNPTGNTLENISLSSPKIVIQKRSSGVTLQEMVSYRDDHYYYFVFNLGKYYNIPVDTPYGYCQYAGVGNVTREMTASSAKASTIEESSTKAQETTTNFSSTKSLSVGVTFGKHPPQATGGWGFDVSIEAGYSRTTGNSTADSWSRTYKEASSYSETESRTTSISFKTGDPAGNYYYYLSIDTQAYGVIVRSIESGDFYVTTASSVIGRGFNYIYTGEERLDFSCDTILDFNYDIIEDLGLVNIVPSNYVGDKVDDGKTHVSNVSELHAALSNSSPDADVVLDRTIDCSNYPWMPIDNFAGKFDGRDYNIENLAFEINNGGNETKFGIFKELSGTFANVNIIAADINVHKFHDTQECMYAGIVCGRLIGGTVELVQIESSNLYAYHDSDDKKLKVHSEVGGFVGELESGSVKNCTISSSNIYGKGRINYDTSSTADVWVHTGGIAGQQNGGTIYGAVRNNDVTVTSHSISGSKTSAYHCHVGGIVGWYVAGTISSCASTDSNLKKNPEVIGGRKANSSTEGVGSIIGNNL